MSDRRTPSADHGRTAIVDRYGALARAARSGVQITDGDPEAVTAGCFGAAAYDRTGDLPEAAVRASLGCGDPTAVAALRPGQTVLDLGSGGGPDVLVSARRAGETERLAAEQLIGCAAGTLTPHAYRGLLAEAGFTAIAITPTGDAAGGLHSAIVRAAKPDST